MPAIVNYAGQSNTYRRLSGNLWKGCDFARMAHEPGSYAFHYDDFHNFSKHISDQATQQYATYIDTGVTFLQLNGYKDGAVQVAGNDADNDEGHMTTGGGTGSSYIISTTAGEKRRLWFESRFKIHGYVTDNSLGMFLGLAEEALNAAGTLVADTGEVGSKDLIGFQILCADGDALKFCYRKAGQSKVLVFTWSTALAIDTWYNVGFRFDPDAPDAEKISIYINNTLQSTFVTATNLAAATFPNGEELALLWSTIVGTGSQENKVSLDYWAVAQEIENGGR